MSPVAVRSPGRLFSSRYAVATSAGFSPSIDTAATMSCMSLTSSRLDTAFSTDSTSCVTASVRMAGTKLSTGWRLLVVLERHPLVLGDRSVAGEQEGDVDVALLQGGFRVRPADVEGHEVNWPLRRSRSLPVGAAVASSSPHAAADEAERAAQRRRQVVGLGFCSQVCPFNWVMGSPAQPARPGPLRGAPRRPQAERRDQRLHEAEIELVESDSSATRRAPANSWGVVRGAAVDDEPPETAASRRRRRSSPWPRPGPPRSGCPAIRRGTASGSSTRQQHLPVASCPCRGPPRGSRRGPRPSRCRRWSRSAGWPERRGRRRS